MIDMKIKKNGKIGEISISGDMVIQHVTELKNYLLDEFKNYGRLKVDIENVSSIDLSHLQLLCSTHKFALKQNKHFELGDKIQDSCKDKFRLSGMFNHLGCDFNENSNCIFEIPEEWWVKQ